MFTAAAVANYTIHTSIILLLLLRVRRSLLAQNPDREGGNPSPSLEHGTHDTVLVTARPPYLIINW